MPSCPDCGAPIAEDGTCRALFDELLAHEYTFPQAFGAVHHVTVAAYFLQHPRGYSRGAIDMWRTIVSESLDGLATPQDFLLRARAQMARGGVKVREPGAEPPENWPRTWPMTVADVVLPPGATPDADGYVDRVRRWAQSIRSTLDQMEASNTA
jgi:hypothetical protein